MWNQFLTLLKRKLGFRVSECWNYTKNTGVISTCIMNISNKKDFGIAASGTGLAESMYGE